EMQSAGEQVEGDFRTNRLLLVLITLFSVAAASLTGWFIVRSITRPLNDAVNFAEAIADGDLTGSIISHGKDETGLLLTALMEMKTRL
ncbi:HAMP domain-containing protein, partial [Pseudomonas donghuensis]|nr:HAMP domain-containing protein [Pseudomonas donghuensis]